MKLYVCTVVKLQSERAHNTKACCSITPQCESRSVSKYFILQTGMITNQFDMPRSTLKVIKKYRNHHLPFRFSFICSYVIVYITYLHLPVRICYIKCFFVLHLQIGAVVCNQIPHGVNWKCQFSLLSDHSTSNHLAHTRKFGPLLFPYLSDSSLTPSPLSAVLPYFFFPSFSHSNFPRSILSHVLAFLLNSASSPMKIQL